MKQRTAQSGFGSLMVVIAILVVAVLAVSGFEVYQHHKSVPTKKAAATTSTQTTGQPASTTTTQPALATTTYLDIKEWGVKAPNGSSDTFTYTLSPDNKSVTIASKLLASKDAGCTNGGAGVIERFAPSDYASAYGSTTVQQDAQQNPGTYVYIGGYYYLFRHAQSACGSVSVADQNQANDAVKAMLAHLQTESNN